MSSQQQQQQQQHAPHRRRTDDDLAPPPPAGGAISAASSSAPPPAAAAINNQQQLGQQFQQQQQHESRRAVVIPPAPYPPMNSTTSTSLLRKSSLSSTQKYRRGNSGGGAGGGEYSDPQPPPPPSSTRSMTTIQTTSVATLAGGGASGAAVGVGDMSGMTRSSSLGGVPAAVAGGGGATTTATMGGSSLVHHHSDPVHEQKQQQQQQQLHHQEHATAAAKLAGGASTTTGAVGGSAAQQQLLAPHSRQIQFCGRDLLASINCLDDSRSVSGGVAVVAAAAAPPPPPPAAVSVGGAAGVINPAQQQQLHRHGTSRKRGPVILELRRLCVNHHHHQEEDDDGGGVMMFKTVPICSSRFNPSLGTSLSSTCLQVAPASALPSYYHDEHGCNQRPPPIATGLTTGALCVHIFHPNSGSNDSTGYPHQHDPDDHVAPSIFTPTIEYYHTSRYHRPATAVAWRPSSSSPRMVAVGLVLSSSGGSSMMMGDPMMAGAGGGSGSGVGIGGGGIGGAGGGRRAVGGVVGGGVVAAAAASAGLGGGGGGRSDRGGDRDHCCFIWDVEHQSSSGAASGTATAGGGRRSKSTPLYKLSHQVGVASLGWVLGGGQTLAVGGQIRNLHLYDLRAGGQQQAPVSVYAHNFGVHGIEPDMNRPWQFATFCRAANEPVKLWDSRRMDSVLGEIKMYGATNISRSGDVSNNASMTVSAVRWSQTEPGKLVVAVGDAIHEYDASTSASRPALINTVYAKEPVVDIALYPYSATNKEKKQYGHQHYSEEKSIDDAVIAEYFPKRLVTVNGHGTVRDLSRTVSSPVAISCRDGRVVHAFGRSLWIGPTNSGPSAMESLKIDELNEDISAKMIRRARCQIASRYSMDTSSNIKILAEDGIQADGSSSRKKENNVRSQREGLLRLWSWIERVESLCSEAAAGAEDFSNIDGAGGGGGSVTIWPAKGLIDAGAWRLLRTGDGVLRDTDEEVFSEALSCITYDSPGRRAALTSCGWAGKFSLENVLGECEELGEFERSSALACWHGDIGQAVEALERGAVYIRGYLNDDRHSDDPRISSQYAETLELVSLSIAGYRGGDLTSSTSGIWRRACANLLQRPDLSNGSPVGSRVAYIHSVLKFLVTLGSGNGYQEVIGDTTLSLCDRVGFACRFLPIDELYQFVEKCILNCQSSGDIEGITITGIEKEGIQIMQSYVDHSADVQTAALVTSRVILPSDWTAERSICFEWLDSYRTLLNSWQMWQSRAMLDVDRADLLRKIKAKQQQQQQQQAAGKIMGDPKQISLSHRRMAATGGGRKPSAGLRQPDPDVQASVPAQLDARCNYCSSPLGLKNQDTHASQWLSKMKPVLSCCQQCRKPLPRCAICMLSLGALNPYMELTKERPRSLTHHHRGPGIGGISGGAGTIAPADDLSSLASLPFAEWFTWCMRCKHGGHAHHLVGWFAKFSVCPVSGCDCRCQFDGIQKLNRPALVAD